MVGGLAGEIDCCGLDVIAGPAMPWIGVAGLGEPPAVAAGGSVTVRVREAEFAVSPDVVLLAVTVSGATG